MLNFVWSKQFFFKNNNEFKFILNFKIVNPPLNQLSKLNCHKNHMKQNIISC